MVEQIVLAANRDQRHQVPVVLVLIYRRRHGAVDEGAETDARDLRRLPAAMSRKRWLMTPAAGCSPDPVVDDQLLQLRHQAPVAADDATDESFMTEMVQAALLAVALACGM